MRRWSPARASVLLLLASCGDSPAPIPPALPYADPGFVSAGEHRMHYALNMTPDLPSEIAGSYGIEQRRNLALLTITLMSQDADAGVRLAPVALSATSVQLTGGRQALALTRHDESGGPTWLATVEVRHRVPLTIEIRARATTESPEMTARLTREFHLE
ncbi:MAG: DUF4426 domain-containing protein [Steroidobacteraceae bacterium]